MQVPPLSALPTSAMLKMPRLATSHQVPPWQSRFCWSRLAGKPRRRSDLTQHGMFAVEKDRLGEGWAARQRREDLARAPDWQEALAKSLAAAWPDGWEARPRSAYWTFMFSLLMFAKSLGGFCGRAAFAERSRSQALSPQLQERRAWALRQVALAFDRSAALFPEASQQLLAPSSCERPALAVVLPTLCRSAADLAELTRTLTALLQQSLRPDLVVLVDDASPIDLSSALEAWPDDAKVRSSLVRVRMEQNCGPAAARSLGLRLLRSWAASGSDGGAAGAAEGRAPGRRTVVCFTDSDAMPDERWCEAMLAAQQRNPGLVSGMTRSAVAGVDASGGSIADRFHDHFGSLNGRWTPMDPHGVLLFGPTCNLSVDLTTIPDNFEFDSAFDRPGYEDVEFCWRARAQYGILTRLCEAAQVRHEYDEGIAGVFGQFFKHGQTQPIIAWIHPTLSFIGSRQVATNFRDPRPPSS